MFSALLYKETCCGFGGRRKMFNPHKEQNRAANLVFLTDTVRSMLEDEDDFIAVLANV
jgi:hypothetical protein